MAEWLKALSLTLASALVRIPGWPCQKVASDYRSDGGFRRVLRVTLPLTADLVIT